MNLKKILRDYYPEFTGIHEACLALPEMSQEDFKALCDDIRENGLLEGIVKTPDGQLLDGRNRLLACYKTDIEIHVKTVKTDPWEYAVSANMARRHLTVGQKAAFGLQLRAHYDAEAKGRMKDGGRGDKVITPSKSRDAAGEAVGVSGASIDKARSIQENRPDLMKDVKNGALSLEAAHKEAKKSERQKASRAAHQPANPQKWKKVSVVMVDGTTREIGAPKTVRFNRTNDSVDWASWTWNPVTGCEHGCEFCYAREIAHSQRMAPFYPFQFKPAYHEYRLPAPKNTPIPEGGEERDGRVFVCSMADLFGKWVPNAWIKSVFNACLEAPEWEYLFLTKWPARYARMPLLEGAWYGASVIRQADVSRVTKAMTNFECGDAIKWVSLEPMLEPIKFDDLSWCNLMVLGAQTQTVQPKTGFVPEKAPEFDWVFDVVNQCREAGVPYYLKENLGLERPGMKLSKMSPNE